MVESLSGGRWQGSSTATATPTKSNSNFGSWTTTGSQVTESSNVISFDITTRTSTHICSQDLGSALSDDKWILRGKLNYTTLTGGGGSTVYFEVGIGSSATGVIDNDGVEIDFIGLQQRMASGSSDTGWGLVGYDSSGGLNNPESPKIDTDSSTGTDYYFEIKRTADNAMSIGIYNSSSYDTLVTGMPLETKSIATSITGLRYLRISNGQVASESSTGNVIEGTISDLKVWNNTTEATEDEKDSLTNVPANTRYEETDTRKIYRRTAEPTANPSYNFSSDSGWTQVGSTVAISSNALRATTVNTNSDDRIYKALGYTLSNSKWVCRFEVTPSSSNYVSIITLSAGTNTLNAYDTIHVDYGSSKLKMREYNGSSMGLDSTGITTSTGTNYFVTLTRTGETGLKLDIRTGSHTGTLVGSETGTISSGTIGLDTFQSGAYGRQAGDATYVVDNVEIYDGVTSTDAQWKERGTA
jgi:hypothetical protein